MLLKVAAIHFFNFWKTTEWVNILWLKYYCILVHWDVIDSVKLKKLNIFRLYEFVHYYDICCDLFWPTLFVMLERKLIKTFFNEWCERFKIIACILILLHFDIFILRVCTCAPIWGAPHFYGFDWKHCCHVGNVSHSEFHGHSSFSVIFLKENNESHSKSTLVGVNSPSTLKGKPFKSL